MASDSSSFSHYFLHNLPWHLSYLSIYLSIYIYLFLPELQKCGIHKSHDQSNLEGSIVWCLNYSRNYPIIQLSVIKNIVKYQSEGNSHLSEGLFLLYPCVVEQFQWPPVDWWLCGVILPFSDTGHYHNSLFITFWESRCSYMSYTISHEIPRRIQHINGQFPIDFDDCPVKTSM